MTQWQFLIQKEGDREWLPLESPNVEILEGRYYLMAQLDCPSAPVEIQIRHEYELEDVPQEVTQRRRQRTDAQGRLELFPLTYLPPGLWELQCQVAGLQDHPENAAPQKLFLQVLAQDFELLSDWTCPEPSPAEAIAMGSAADIRPATSVAPAQPPTQAPATAVRLPLIPKEIAPLPLRLSDPFSMPPMLYKPQPSADGAMSPELPAFLPSEDLFTDNLLADQLLSGHLTSMPIAMMEPALSFLDRVAKTTDRQEAYKAFEPLARRQRFLETLNTLAQDAPSSRESLMAKST
jgi:hypothetical protein